VERAGSLGALKALPVRWPVLIRLERRDIGSGRRHARLIHGLSGQGAVRRAARVLWRD